MSVVEFLALIGAGAAIGLYATVVGAGGGFLLTPLLLLRHEGALPAEVTMAALLVVALSSGLATGSALRGRRIDLPVCALLVAVTVPAALAGATVTTILPRATFAVVFASLLFVVGAFLVIRPHPAVGTPGSPGWRRRFRDGEGRVWMYRVPLRRALTISAVAAFVSALAGIGGGLIFTPINTHVGRMPHALAVPATHFVIATLAAAVVIFQGVAGHADTPLEDVPALAIGVIVASRFAPRLQRRLGAGLLTRALAIGILAVAARTAFVAL